MKLPHREKAYVPIEKIRDYLLVETHPDGWSKAKLLRALGHDERTMDIGDDRPRFITGYPIGLKEK